MDAQKDLGEDQGSALERAIPVMPPQNPLISMEIDAILLFDNPETISHWPVVVLTVLPRDEKDSEESAAEVPLASIRGVDMIPHVILQLSCARKILSHQIAQGGSNFIENIEPDNSTGGDFRIRYELNDDGSVTKKQREVLVLHGSDSLDVVDMDTAFYVSLSKNGQRLEFPDSLDVPERRDELAAVRSITTAAVLEILRKAGPRKEDSELSHLLM